MRTDLQRQTATIYQFPLGGRSGQMKAVNRQPAEANLRSASLQPCIDWRAPYHAEAIDQDDQRQH
ncbi:MAG: DUF2735 domain-containing protein [Fulvimarina manganoxydans]|uniref:DUF2735 domain-containing protein n=1 Tax=Fulvimarina manganoxydans TaxID=937218 RepID=UPI002356E3EE|nr:DUF2735 domain-containing protein [Fulvimarina manganoxydans]MCK5934171.1 DUF2735 domain-containing protein [Fulvimarina manganoxydans]